MRKTGLGVLLIAIAIVVQLSVLNGLRLPGGGVPDLVLVLVATFALAEGPIPGMVIGFGAGLCLDLAPPASQLIGQYALIFCLTGWAAGRLGAVATRSAWRATALLAVVVVLAEAATAALGVILEPAQVTVAGVRQVLPVAIAYDLLILPFVAYLVLAANSLVSAGLADGASPRSVLAAPVRGHATGQPRAGRKGRARVPRLAPAAARHGDGWLSGVPHGISGSYPAARRRASPARFRAAGGVAGSASGLIRHPGAVVPPVNLRLVGGRRGDGVIGNSAGSALGRPPSQPVRHPGLLAGRSRGFRPHGGELGGSASGRTLTPPIARSSGRAPIRFGARRGDASVGRALGHSAVGQHQAAFSPARRAVVPKIRFRVTRAPAANQRAAEPKIDFRVTRTPAANRRTTEPKIRFRAAKQAPARRPVAEPRFGRQSARVGPLAAASGLISGGVPDQATFRALRSRRGMPKLRFGRTRRRSGMLGGSASLAAGTASAHMRTGQLRHTAQQRSPRFRVSPARRRAGRPGRQPKFGYGRRSVLNLLSRSKFGGTWLASKRVGSRSGVWVLSRRTGGLR